MNNKLSLPTYVPCFTPNEMMELGVFQEDKNNNFYKVESNNKYKSWFEAYKVTGNPGENWIDMLIEAYGQFITNRTDSNRQTLLELGWNPEVLLNTYSLNESSNITKDKLYSKYAILEVVDSTEENPLLDTVENTMTQMLAIFRGIARDLFKSQSYSNLCKYFNEIRLWNDDGTMSIYQYSKSFVSDDIVNNLILDANAAFFTKTSMKNYRLVNNNAGEQYGYINLEFIQIISQDVIQGS